MDALMVLTSLGGAALTGGGVSAILAAMAKRRTAPADIASRLSAAAMAQVDQLQERVHEAEQEAIHARQESTAMRVEANEARQQMRAVRREAADLAERLSQLCRWVHDPQMTIDRLRTMVPLEIGRNGVQP